MIKLVSGQLPPEGNCPAVRVGVWFKVRISFGVGGSNQTIAPKENCPPVRVRIWVRVSFGVGGKFSSRAIVLEPIKLRVLFPRKNVKKFVPTKFRYLLLI